MARHLIAVAVAAALFSAGCSSPEPELLQADVDAAVAAAITDVSLRSVACPDVDGLAPVLERESVALDCTADMGGDLVELAVRLTRATEGSMVAHVDVETPILDLAAVETAAAAQLQADLGGAPAVACAEAAVVITVGREIACRVTDDGGTAGPVDLAVVIRLLDADGTWELDLTP